jgi:hypothetical protein
LVIDKKRSWFVEIFLKAKLHSCSCNFKMYHLHSGISDLSNTILEVTIYFKVTPNNWLANGMIGILPLTHFWNTFF